MHSGGETLGAPLEGESAAWYAVYTKHQHEKSAADLLARKGFDVLLPLHTAAHRWKDRSQVVTLPLFPCYVFLRTIMERKVDALRTPGVFWFVGNGGRADEIPESEIDAIRRVVQSPARIEPHPFLNSGDRVRINSGVLIGIEGLLIRFKNQYRVVLCVELLKKAVAVEVDVSMVQPVTTASKSGFSGPDKSASCC